MQNNRQDNNQTPQEEATVEFKVGNKISFNSLYAIITQTLVIIISVVVLGSTYLNRLDEVAEDQSQMKTEMQSLRSEVITRNEAAVQFSYINEQLKRQDQDIREIQNGLRRSKYE